MPRATIRSLVVGLLVGTGAAVVPAQVTAGLLLGLEELVQANGADISVTGYSVPSFVRWDADELPDLVLGELAEGGAATGKVRVYLNVGTTSNPQFGDHFFVQSEGSDLTVPGVG